MTASSPSLSDRILRGASAPVRAARERSLEGRERRLGAQHSSTLISVNNLAMLLMAQGKLAEARSRQAAISNRLESAITRARTNEMLHGSRTQDAFSRFETLERRADMAEGYADALGLSGPKSLEEEIAELKSADKVGAEPEELKAALAARL